jgi:hypothetical protein
MWLKHLLIVVLFLGCQIMTAQQKTPNKDSIKVYKDLEKYSKKSGFGKFVHKLLFRTTRATKVSQKNLRKKYLIKKSFDKYEGKIIRNINIETLDPFGYSVDNPADVPNKGFEKFGNALHLKSKNWTIRNLLLFKKNDRLDSLVAKESERLIRRQRYTRSVIIKPIPIENSKDSVDVSIRVLDSWTFIPTGSISSSRSNVELTERNFLGLGHEFQNDFTNSLKENKSAYSSKYTISNIKNTFINSTFNYNNDLQNNTVKSIRMERVFFSPLTHFAGGAYYENRFFRDSLPDFNNDYEVQIFRNTTKDFWLGYAFKVIKEKIVEARTTNLVTTVGFKNVNYHESPSDIYDSSNFFSSEKLYLSSIGITSRKFAEDKYIFNYGIIEDIPYGQVYSITGGFQDKNNLKRAYFGARFAYGDYFKIGYLGTNVEWGSLFNNGNTEETTLRIEANYFTNLMAIGNWKIRHFVNSAIIFGNHRDSSIKDRLNINDANGIQGFDSPLLVGTKKLVMSLQTQSYVPGNWHGFRFSPFLNFTMAMLGDESNKMFDSKLYSKIGIGVLINNDYLVFNSFQLSIAFFPSIPNQGTNIFKTNTFKNSDLVIPDYQIGQPTIVPFR